MTSYSPISSYRASGTLALVVLTAACATVKEMPLSRDPRALPPADKAIFLVTLTQRNVFKPSYQPKLFVANVERSVVKGSEDRLNFKNDGIGKTETESPESGNTYLVRLELDVGDYVIRGFTSLNHSLFIHASFFAPLHAPIHVPGPGVYYLGHIDAIVRERAGEEFRAGIPIPLIDQGVAGASGGTFDVIISDQWSIDGPLFLRTFQALAGVGIKKMILPPFNRALAQKWWNEH